MSYVFTPFYVNSRLQYCKILSMPQKVTQITFYPILMFDVNNN